MLYLLNDLAMTIIDSIMNGEVQELRNKLLAGCDPNYMEEGTSALNWALTVSDAYAVRLLLQFGASPDFCDDDGETPLIRASCGGFLEAAQELIVAGANVNLGDALGQTALMVAAKYGHIDLVDLLLRNGARIDIKDQSGRGALHWAATEGDHAEVAERLIRLGADPHEKNALGISSFEYATRLDRHRMLLVMKQK